MVKNRDVSSFSERLREVIDRAGGPSAAARSAGIPLSSLNSYLDSSEAPASRAVALARVCSVSYVWLAAGEGEMEAKVGDLSPLDAEMLDAPCNFFLLILSLRTCHGAFKNKPKPTLREVLVWISGPYALHASIKDRDVDFKSLDEVPL